MVEERRAVASDRCRAVKTSSNWSTTTSRPAAGLGQLRRQSRGGVAPGLQDHRLQPGLAARSAGTSPARTTDDLPLPDGPSTARKGCFAEPVAQALDQLLAAEEEPGVVGRVVRRVIAPCAVGTG